MAHVRCTINLDMSCAALSPLLVEDFAQVRGGNSMDILINKQCVAVTASARRCEVALLEEACRKLSQVTFALGAEHPHIRMLDETLGVWEISGTPV